ncbi:MAG: hypothetical protein LBC78_02835, partial [Oscillospiraceae bacterium]|nr:hypothetical protein [Oscillospiraceae bacterium]
MRIQHFVKDITAAKRIFSNIEVVQNSANSAYYTIKNWNLMCTAFHELSGLSGFNAKYVNEIFKMGI